jgi:hypothetical protein
MKKHFSLLLAAGVVLVIAVGVSAGDLGTKGKAWLDPHNEPAAVNLNGNWYDKEWGKVVLNQAEGGREVTGKGDGWDITGVVSGKQAFLLFSHHERVNYSAQLTLEADGKLNGTYSKGFMKENSKGNRPMHLTKQ